MNKEKIFDSIKDSLKIFNIQNTITKDSNIIKDFGFDSLDRMAFIIELSEKFNLNLLEEDIENCFLINDFIILIENKINESEKNENS